MREGPDRLARIRAEGQGREPQEVVRELCHDLRGSAATILALASAATVESDLAPAAQARLGQIVDEARRILDFCLDTVGAAKRGGPVPIHEIADGAATSAGHTSDVSIEVRTTPTYALGSAPALGRAISNLVENGVRAAGPGGAVNIDVGGDNRTARIVVSDSGPGFGNSSDDHGLGLRIVGRVVAEHGGEVVVSRSADLGGAEVTIVLPAYVRNLLACPA